MRPAAAIAELEDLKGQALADPSALRGGGRDAAWKSKVEAVLTRALGPTHHTTAAFISVRYNLRVQSERTPDSARVDVFVAGVRNACGQIDAAIYELGLLTANDTPVDDRAFDPDLWDHVKTVVADEDWGKVAGLVAIFVEDRVRVWAGHPKDRNGDDLFGKQLYADVFADSSTFRLGQRAGEFEGWRMLGMGFAQAVGNVDRHKVQVRPDARRYALGVLGLGSLLLTQLRFEHEDVFNGV
jgi:hypothetical protein